MDGTDWGLFYLLCFSFIQERNQTMYDLAIIGAGVVGTAIGLPGIWVLSAVVIGGGMMGIPGMLLGVPIASALYRLLRNDINHSNTLEKHK